MNPSQSRRLRRPPLSTLAGFTLLELLVVLAVIATLVSVVAPRYWRSVDKAQVVVLRENLRSLRTAIDHHFADLGRYPESLQNLVEHRYLRSIPKDPIINSAQKWIIVAPANGQLGLVYDVRSAAPGTAADGQPFADF